ncbi:MAG: pantothenate kinase, partial [bacterium]
AGLVLGAAALVDGLLQRVFDELGERVPVVATGGTAPVVVPHCRLVREIVPELALEGVRLVAARGGSRR